MCISSDQYERICKHEFTDIKNILSSHGEKMDMLDCTLRGTMEKPGMLTRIDRLERDAATRNKLMWIITIAVVSMATTILASGINEWLKAIE